MKTITRSPSFFAVALSLLFTAGAAHSKTINVNTETTPLRVVTVTEGLKNPWGLDFLPDGKMIVTERGGQMRIVQADGTKGPALKGVPEVVARGQGGLLDVTVAPDFATSKRIYFSFSEPAKEGKGNSTAVAYGILKGDALEDVTVVFTQQPKFDSTAHFGSRIVFTPDGYMFVTLGDRYSRMDDAQTLDNHHGKVVRIKPDGSVPEDNPFVKTNGALPEIWSYGHRNVQGLAYDSTHNILYATEHGPRGGDELNSIEKGKNYGWPVITYGIDYSGAIISELTEKEGMEQPIHYWTPSIAACGLLYYTGNKFPEWQGNLFSGALALTHVARVELKNGNYAHEEKLLQGIGRVRHIAQSPDGYIYVLTEGPGMLLKLTPAE